MIIESVDIRRFGCLSDFKAVFDRGFNLIEGPAESGKTTLAAFVVYMLYGFPVEGGECLTERTRRMPWDGTEAEGSMVFSADGVRYCVTRTSTVTERGWRDTYSLLNLDTEEAEEGAVVPGERFLGVSYETFLDTAFLRDVHRGGPDGGRMTDAIENIIFSGDEKLSFSRAIGALSEVAHELVAHDSKSGAVAVLEKDKELLEDELAQAVASEKQHFKREEELFLTRRKMQEARKELEKFQKLEANFYNALMIDDYDRLHALEDATAHRVGAIRTHADAYCAAGFLPDQNYLSALRSERAEAQGAQAEKSAAQAALDALPEGKDVISEAETNLIANVEKRSGEKVLRENEKNCLQKTIREMTLATLCVLLFACFLVGFFLTRQNQTLSVFLGGAAVLSLGGMVLFLLEGMRDLRRLRAVYSVFSATGRDDFLLSLQRAAEAKLRAEHADSERARAQVRLSRAKERLILAYKALEARLSSWGVAFDESEDLTDAIDAVLTRGEEFITQDERLRAEHRAAEAEVLALREKLKGQNEVAVRARVAPDDRKLYRNQNAEALRHGVEMYTERLETLSKDEESLMRELAEEPKDTETAAAIAERILALDARIAILLADAEAMLAAKEALEGGEERLRGEISPRLALDACRLLYEMTDGKYSALSVSEGFSLSFDDGEGERSVAYLSHSTEDLTYYALRLSLLSLLYRESPPVCFDGCTARQDDERALSFLRAVRALTEEKRQCFFFASGAREKELVGKVFSSYGRIVMPA